MSYQRIEREIAGKPMVMETGKWAKQADGAVVVTYGGTTVLCTAQSADAREGLDFFPLTVDYREKTYAAGKIPGGFFKREARPTTKEILTCRLIDRPIRPLFPDGYKNEVQVMATVLSFDGETDPDIVGMIAAFAAVNVSSMPFDTLLGACRVGLKDGVLLLNPTVQETQESALNLTMAAWKEAVVMVEAGAREVPETVILEALEAGQNLCIEIGSMIQELVKKAGKEKVPFVPPEGFPQLAKELEKKFKKKVEKAVSVKGSKHDRGEAVAAVKAEMEDYFAPKLEKLGEKDAPKAQKFLSAEFKKLRSNAERNAILAGKRSDGRGYKDIRPISIEVSLFPRTHGSAVFTRGETQAMVILTLGTTQDEQIIDGLSEEYRKRFMLHYNFPPYCVGEVRPIRGVSRREIGHGALAERALEVMLPEPEKFPYTIRIVSEILESNGSSSMASVCGGTLAMMDAGVPIKQPVAGIAMGLVKEGRKTAILSDILGSEDHVGDMDFKVTGTQRGITALQMDIKCSGLTRALMKKALEQAKEGRVHILKEMLQAIRRPRKTLSSFAPRLERIKVNPDKIGLIIGPGGKNIRSLQEETKTRVNIDDDGTVLISGTNPDGVEEAVKRIQAMTAEVEVGKLYKGRVVAVKEFGAFIEVLPGQEGFCHVSELSDDFVRSVTDVAKVGDILDVKVDSIDELGRIRLTRKGLGSSSGDSRGYETDEGFGESEEESPASEDRKEKDSRRRKGSNSSRGGEGRRGSGGKDSRREREGGGSSRSRGGSSRGGRSSGGRSRGGGQRRSGSGGGHRRRSQDS